MAAMKPLVASLGNQQVRQIVDLSLTGSSGAGMLEGNERGLEPVYNWSFSTILRRSRPCSFCQSISTTMRPPAPIHVFWMRCGPSSQNGTATPRAPIAWPGRSRSRGPGA